MFKKFLKGFFTVWALGLLLFVFGTLCEYIEITYGEKYAIAIYITGVLATVCGIIAMDDEE